MKSSTSVACAILIALAACTTDRSKASDTGMAVRPNGTQDKGMAVTPPVERPQLEPATPPAPPLEDAGQWKVTANGIGPVKVGMSLNEARRAVGNSLTIPANLQECDYVRPKSPKGVAFMVEKGEISRVDIQLGSEVATAAGAKIGDSEDRIKSLYPGVEVKPAKYSAGHDMEVTPQGGGNNRIVFETDGKKVVKYRSGRLPAVEYVEGCS